MDGTIDKLPLSRAERHPEKAHRPDNPIRRKPAWIRVKAPNSPEYARDPAPDARVRAAHRLRGGGLPQYRRVLDAEARDLDDHGRHLHAGLRLLQRRHRHARRARPARARAASPRRWPSWASSHVVITSVDRDDLPMAAPGISPRSSRRSALAAPATTIEVLTPGFPAQAGRGRDRRRGAARRVQPQSRDRAAALSRRSGPARAIYQSLRLLRAGQGARSRDVHQVRPDGRAGREHGRGHAGDGRPARRPTSIS